VSWLLILDPTPETVEVQGCAVLSHTAAGIMGAGRLRETGVAMDWRQRIRLNVLVVVAIMAIAPGVIIWNQSVLEHEFRNMSTCAYLEEYLLEARRYEKNFFLRGGEEYLRLQSDFLEKLGDATRQLRGNDEIAARIEMLLQKESEYGQRFSTLASEVSDGTRSREVEDAAVLAMVGVARECETLIREIRGVTADRFHAAVTRAHFVNFLSLLIGVLLAVIVSGLIADRVVYQPPL